MLTSFISNYCPDTHILDDYVKITNKQINRIGIDGKQLQKEITFTEKKVLIKGHLQSGKTKFMIGSAVKHLSYGFSPIILFRNIINDHIQTKNRINKFIEDYKGNETMVIKVFDELSETDEVIKMLTASPPVICILISNEKKMEKIVKQLKRKTYYTLFMDEVDEVDSFNAEVRSPLINQLKDNAKFVVGVSATILGTYIEWNLTPNCVRELSTPLGYIGIPQLKTHYCNTGVSSVKNDTTIEKIFSDVPCLEKYIDEIQSTPMVDLISITHFIEPHKIIYEYIKSKYPDIALILMVEYGFRIYHTSLPKKPIKLLGIRSRLDDDDHLFSTKVDLGNVMSVFEKINKAKNLVILAGAKASRAITFSSTVNKIDRWHVNRALIKFSNGITYDEAMQKAGRLCGIFKEGAEQILYASKKDLEIIKKAYYLQEDILNETIRSDSDMKSEDLIKTLEISEWKIKVDDKTPTGRDKTFYKKIVSRDNIRPIIVEDDGREMLFDFNEPTQGIADEREYVENSTRKEILRILEENDNLTAAEIFEKSNNWSFIKAKDPKSAVSQMCKTMNREGIIERSGRPYKYYI